MNVFYTHKQSVDQGGQNFSNIIKSPSANKPSQLAERLINFPNINFVEPQPLTRDDLKLAHDSKYVDSIMDLERDNGFGNRSKDVAESLLYTNGAMYYAAKSATPTNPTCALVSGFHHAGYDKWRRLGYFCTFNGLMITALKLLQDGMKRIFIVDADMHWGNGTDDILNFLPNENINHFSFGKYFTIPVHADKYLECLERMDVIDCTVNNFRPDVILYQAGADTHVDDPYGVVLTTEQMYERDKRMFIIAKETETPIVWNLAGGYQIDENGSCDKVIELHLNTFRACQEIYT